jgi:hypothetical protein
VVNKEIIRSMLRSVYGEFETYSRGGVGYEPGDTKVGRQLEKIIPLLNQLEFKKMSIQDGFGTVDHSLLMTTMKRFVANGTI